MQPSTDQIAHYLLCKGLQANTTYAVFNSPEGLVHTMYTSRRPEGFKELVRFTTDEWPPESLDDMIFMLTFEGQWTFSINTKNGPRRIF